MAPLICMRFLPLSRPDRSSVEVCKICVILGLGSDNCSNCINGLVEGHAAISCPFRATHLMFFMDPSLEVTQNRPKHHFPSVDMSADQKEK